MDFNKGVSAPTITTTVANISDAQIDSATANKITTENIFATNANIDNGTIGTATINTANISNGQIDSATINLATATNINATNANLTNIDADSAHIANLSVDAIALSVADINIANIQTLNATSADIDSANIANLSVTALALDTANIDTANIDVLNAVNANLTNINADSANITNLSSNITTSNNSTIKDLTVTTNFQSNAPYVEFKSDVVAGANSNTLIHAVSSTNETLFEIRKDGSINLTGDIYKDGLPFTAAGIFKTNSQGYKYYDSVGSRVGLFTDEPYYPFHIDNSQVLFSGDINPFSTDVDISTDNGNKSRFMFIPQKGVTRSGYFQGHIWDGGLFGDYSTAFGRNVEAGGIASFAAGDSSSAGGNYSIVLGRRNRLSPSSQSSIAIGLGNEDSSTTVGGPIIASNAILIGTNNITNRSNTTLIGQSNKIGVVSSTGNIAIFGYSNTSKAANSTIIGRSNTVTSSGSGSYTLGTSNSVDGVNAFVFGLTNTVTNTGPNSFALGTSNNLSGSTSYAIGSGLNISGDFSVGISLSGGSKSNIATNNTFSIQGGRTVFGVDGDSVGYTNSYGNFDVYINAQNDGLYADEGVFDRLDIKSGGDLNVTNISYSGNLIRVIDGEQISANTFEDYGPYVGYLGGKKVGINVSYPKDALSVDGSILTYGTTGSIYGLGDSSVLDSSVGENKFLFSPTGGLIRAGAIPYDSNLTLGLFSVAMGFRPVASGNYSVAFGDRANASGVNSIAMGSQSTASGQYSVSLGRQNYNNNNNDNTFLIGNLNQLKDSAVSSGVFAFGLNNDILNDSAVTNSYVIGYDNELKGDDNYIFGKANVIASPASASTAIGHTNSVSGNRTYALGEGNTIADVTEASVIGYQNTIGGSRAYAFGRNNEIDSAGANSFAVGEQNTVSANYSYVIGEQNQITSTYSYVLGSTNSTTGTTSHVLGSGVTTNGTNINVIGSNVTANGTNLTVINASSSSFTITDNNLVVIPGSANVAIGKISADYKLDVAGDINIDNGNLYLTSGEIFFNGTTLDSRVLSAGLITNYLIDYFDSAYVLARATVQEFWQKSDSAFYYNPSAPAGGPLPVGIRTSTPNLAYSLDVVGGINADSYYISGVELSNYIASTIATDPNVNSTVKNSIVNSTYISSLMSSNDVLQAIQNIVVDSSYIASIIDDKGVIAPNGSISKSIRDNVINSTYLSTIIDGDWINSRVVIDPETVRTFIGDAYVEAIIDSAWVRGKADSAYIKGIINDAYILERANDSSEWQRSGDTLFFGTYPNVSNVNVVIGADNSTTKFRVAGDVQIDSNVNIDGGLSVGGYGLVVDGGFNLRLDDTFVYQYVNNDYEALFANDSSFVYDLNNARLFGGGDIPVGGPDDSTGATLNYTAQYLRVYLTDSVNAYKTDLDVGLEYYATTPGAGGTITIDSDFIAASVITNDRIFIQNRSIPDGSFTLIGQDLFSNTLNYNVTPINHVVKQVDSNGLNPVILTAGVDYTIVSSSEITIDNVISYDVNDKFTVDTYSTVYASSTDLRGNVNISYGYLSVQDSAQIGTNLTVGNNLSVVNDVTINNDLSVLGDITAPGFTTNQNTTNILNATIIHDSTTINSITRLNGDVYIDSQSTLYYGPGSQSFDDNIVRIVDSDYIGVRTLSPWRSTSTYEVVYNDLGSRIAIGRTYIDSSIAFYVDSGTIVFNQNNFDSDPLSLKTNVISSAGAGARMAFVPQRAAFRAGAVTGTQWNEANIGLGTVAIGYDAYTTGYYSVAIGKNVSAASTNLYQASVAIGYNSTALKDNTLAIGSTAYADEGIAIGSSVTSGIGESIAIGISSTALRDAIAIGASSYANIDGTAVGISVNAGLRGVTVGKSSTVGTDGVTVGISNTATGLRGVTVGNSSTVGTDGVTVGISNPSIGARALTVGRLSRANADGVAVGLSAISGSAGVVIGRSINSSTNAVSIGIGNTTATSSVSAGLSSYSGLNSTSVGYAARSITSATAIGRNVTANSYSIAIGDNITTSNYEIAIGKNITSNYNSVVVGRNHNNNNSSDIFGNNNDYNANNSVVFGKNNNNNNLANIYGQDNSRNSAYAFVVGKDNSYNTQYSVIIGHSNTQFYRANIYGSGNTGTNSNSQYGYIYGTGNNVTAGGMIYGSSSTIINGGFVFGASNNVAGGGYAFGGSNTVTRTGYAFGQSNTVGLASGTNNPGYAFGEANTAYNSGFALGRLNEATNYGIAIGTGNYVDGTNSIALGTAVEITGSNSVVIGLDVSGGDTVTANNVFVIQGGTVGINKVDPNIAYSIDISGNLNVDSTGDYYRRGELLQDWITRVAVSTGVTETVNETYIKSFVDSNYISTVLGFEYLTSPGLIGVDYIRGIADSAYILSAANEAYVKNIADETYVKSLADSAYILSAANEAHVKSLADSAWITSIANEAYVKSFIDSGYTQQIVSSDRYFGTDNHNTFYTGIGNVGVKTTDPQYDLDVNGDINFTGRVYSNGVLVVPSLTDDPVGGFTITQVSQYFYIDSATRVTDLIDSYYVRDHFDYNLYIDADYINARTIATIDSARLLNIVNSAYVEARYDHLRIIDSAYVQNRANEEYITSFIDSAYVTSRFNYEFYIDDAYINSLVDISGFPDSNFVLSEIADATAVKAFNIIGRSGDLTVPVVNERAYYVNTAGYSKVGIGISPNLPKSGLDVNGIIKVRGDLFLEADDNGVYGQIYVNGAPLEVNTGFIDNGSYFIYDPVSLGGARLNVGIHKSSPLYELDVSGYINADEGILIDGRDLLGEILDSDYIQTRANEDYIKGYIDSNYLYTVVDANYLQPLVEEFVDSTYVQGIITSQYVKSIANETYVKSLADSAWITSIADETYVKSLADSAWITSIADEEYVKGIADSAWITSIADETYVKSLADSAWITSIADEEYVKGIADETYVKGIADETYVKSLADSAWITSIADEAYVKNIANETYVKSLADSAWITSIADEEYVKGIADSAYIQTAISEDYLSTLVDSNYVFSRTGIGKNNINFGTHKISYSNVYTNATLPNPGIYTGMFAVSSTDNWPKVSVDGNWKNIALGNQSVGIADSVTFSGLQVTNDVIVNGNLQVNGTQTTINSTSLEINDPFIYLNGYESNGSPTIFTDIGIAANYNDTGSYRHTGFFRDATDGIWKVFEGYQPEPDAAPQLDTEHATFRFAGFRASTLAGKYLGFDSDLGSITTDDLTEGLNLYYTNARVDSNFAGKTTDDLTEGLNLYYTTARVDSDVLLFVDSAYINARVGSVSNIDASEIVTDTVIAGQITNTSGTTIGHSNNGVSITTFDPTVIDTITHNSAFLSAEYLIHAQDGDNNHTQISKILLTYNTINVNSTEYGIINTYENDSNMGSYDISESSGDIVIKFTKEAGTGNIIVKPVKTIIK